MSSASLPPSTLDQPQGVGSPEPHGSTVNREPEGDAGGRADAPLMQRAPGSAQDSAGSAGTRFLFMKPMPRRGGDQSSFELTPSVPASGSPRATWQSLIKLTESVDGGSGDGLRLGHFLVRRLIGRGGMGAVFAAVDTRLDRTVALKVLSPEHSGTTAAIDRFRNEAKAAARLDHDNIARVFYVGEDQGLHFIAFEFVQGGNLRERIRKHGRMAPPEVIRLALQVAAALRHTASCGVVHRDVKPSNIILTPSGRAKLVDLGLARKHDPDATHDITVAGTTLGTFDYISPEQARDPREVDVRSDLYSLGCTLYHALTGMPPYPDGSMMQKLLDHQDAAVPRVRDAAPNVSVALSDLVHRMMSPSPDLRPQTPDEVIAELSAEAIQEGLVAGGSSGDGLVWTRPRQPDRPLWRRHFGWLASASLLVLIAGFVAFAPTGLSTATNSDVAANESGPLPSSDAGGLGAAAAPNGSLGDEAALVADVLPDDPLPERLRGVLDGSAVVVTEGGIGTEQVPSPESLFDGTGQTDVGATLPIGEIAVSGAGSGSAANMGLAAGIGPGGQKRTRGPSDAPAASLATPTPSQRVAGDDLAVIAPQTDDGRSPFGMPLRSGPSSPSSLTARGSDPSSTARSAATPSDLPVAAATGKPFLLTSGVASRNNQRFETLQQAVRAARDQDVIEILGGGVVPGVHQARLFGQQLTIRSPSGGPRPTIRLAPDRESGLGDGLITLAEGSELGIFNVDLVVESNEDIVPRAAFAVTGPSGLRLEGTTVTFRLPKADQLSKRLPALVAAEQDQGLLMQVERRPGTLDLESCLVRGAADLVDWDGGDLFEVSLQQVGVAIDGALVKTGDAMGQDDSPTLQVSLDHVTAILPGPLVAIDADRSGAASRIEIESKDSVFAGLDPTSPLIRSIGLTRLTVQAQVRWDGRRNRFHWPSQLAWKSPESGDSQSLPDWLDEAPSRLGDAVASRSVAGAAGSATRSTAEFGPAEFAAPTDSGIKGTALDGTDAGVAVREIELLFETASGAASPDAEAP